MKFEVGKKYRRKHSGIIRECLAVTEDQAWLRAEDGYITRSHTDLSEGLYKEYVEPKQMVRYLAMRADDVIGPFRKREDAMNVGRHQLPVLSVKRVEFVEGEFDE